MKEKIEETLRLLIERKLTEEEANKILLDLHSVSNQRELLTIFINEIKDVAPYFIQHKPNDLVEVFIKNRQ